MLDKHNWIPSFCSCYKSVEQLCSYSTNLAWFQTIKLKAVWRKTPKHHHHLVEVVYFVYFKNGWIYTFSNCKGDWLFCSSQPSLVGSESSPISSPQREAKGADLVGTLTKKIKSKLLHDYSSTTADVFSGHPMRSTGLMSRLLFFHRLLWLKVTTPRKRAKPICF